MAIPKMGGAKNIIVSEVTQAHRTTLHGTLHADLNFKMFICVIKIERVSL